MVREDSYIVALVAGLFAYSVAKNWLHIKLLKAHEFSLHEYDDLTNVNAWRT